MDLKISIKAARVNAGMSQKDAALAACNLQRYLGKLGKRQDGTEGDDAN